MNKYLSYKILFFNFILSVLIVLLHSNCKVTLGWNNDGTNLSNFIELLTTYISCIGHIAVPMFYIISAYLFYHNISTLKDTLSKIKKRIKTLLIPYLLWNTFFVSIFWIILHSPFSKYLHMNNNLNSIHSILIAIINSDLTPLWFIKNLFIFTILSPVIQWA
ncbi:acyltransferase family protein, partial [Phocaeicola dorei]|nr:acyltransferase family protein [Phocaeicola dorei]